jgi:hypothetical protein
VIDTTEPFGELGAGRREVCVDGVAGAGNTGDERMPFGRSESERERAQANEVKPRSQHRTALMLDDRQRRRRVSRHSAVARLPSCPDIVR